MRNNKKNGSTRIIFILIIIFSICVALISIISIILRFL